MSSCPSSGDELDRMILRAVEATGSIRSGAYSSVGMVLRSGRRLGGMSGGVKKCSLAGLTLCSLIFIAAAWAGQKGCTIAVPVLLDYLYKNMPGEIDAALEVGSGFRKYLTDHFEGMCLIIRGHMKTKGDTAFKVVFDEITKHPLTSIGVAAGISTIVSTVLNFGTAAQSQISSFAMEICERSGLIVDTDGSAGASAGRAAMNRAASAVPGGSRRKMRRKGSKGKKSMMGGRRRSMGKSKKNKK